MAWYFRNFIPFFAKSQRRRKIVVKRKMYKDLVALNKLPSLKRDCCTFFFVSPLTWREKPRMKGWRFLGGIKKEISAGKISNLTDVMICMRANKVMVPFLRRRRKSTFLQLLWKHITTKTSAKLNTNQSYVFYNLMCITYFHLFWRCKKKEKRIELKQGWSSSVRGVESKNL